MIRKKYLVVIGVLICSAVWSFSASADVGPDISFKETEKDFGTVQGGTVLKHTFEFKNTGDQDLIIKNVKTTCGCTVASPSGKKIKPGERGQLSASFNTRGYHNLVQHYIHVDTNVSHMPRVTLIIKANVVYDLEVRPAEYLAFYNVKQEETVTKELTISNNTSEPLELGKPVFVKNPSNLFNAELLEEKAGKFYRLKVKFAAQKKAGRYQGEIRIKTNKSKKPEITIPLSAAVLAEVYVIPYSIIIQRKGKHHPRFKSIKIINTGDTELKILDVNIDSPHLTYQLNPIKNTGDYRLTVAVKKEAPKSVIKGRVRIKTNNPRIPELSVHYYVSEE